MKTRKKTRTKSLYGSKRHQTSPWPSPITKRLHSWYTRSPPSYSRPPLTPEHTNSCRIQLFIKYSNQFRKQSPDPHGNKAWGKTKSRFARKLHSFDLHSATFLRTNSSQAWASRGCVYTSRYTFICGKGGGARIYRGGSLPVDSARIAKHHQLVCARTSGCLANVCTYIRMATIVQICVRTS